MTESTPVPAPPVDLLRRETSEIEFPGALWTSFDRYSRYGAIVRTLRSALGPGRHRVLDVGDSTGYLQVFDDDLEVTTLDIEVVGEPVRPAQRLRGDGRRMPFPDRTFDAVVSSDALEHVPAQDRPDFARELARVSRSLVVLAAPFDTPGVGSTEELVRRFVHLSSGSVQPQLEEHRAYGLPDLELVCGVLREAGLTVHARGNGNLQDWLLMMLVKHQISARPALGPLGDGYDVLYNGLLAGRNDVGPHYRHVVAASWQGEVVPQPGPVPAAPLPDVPALLGGLLAANVAEASRQDTVPRLDAILAQAPGQLAAVAQVRAEVAELRQQLAQVQAALAATGELVSQISQSVSKVLHPVGELRRRAGR